MPITCCEVAIALAFTNILSLAVFAGYTIKIRQNQVELEKKNGREQRQIDNLKFQDQELEKKLKNA